jgi:hypothetical protein
MGAAIAQSYAPGAAFSHRIFTNGSGRRSTEPSTVTVAAAQQTLTELLFHLAFRIRQAFPDSSPLGMTLMPESLSILKRIKADFLDQSVASIAGTTASGAAIKSPENQKLVSIGHKWALHVTEAPLVWGIHALYVLIVLGWTIPFGYTIPVTQTVVRLILLAVGNPSNLLLLNLLDPAFILADIGIATFGPWTPLFSGQGTLSAYRQQNFSHRRCTLGSSTIGIVCQQTLFSKLRNCFFGSAWSESPRPSVA